MKEYLSIEEKVELTLSSIDGIQAVTAPKFLYARVLRKIKNRQSNIFDKIFSYESEPVIALAIILLVLILDIQIITNNPNDSLPDTAVQSIYQEDYDLALNFYDYDTREQ